ncbi:MAG: hypothetical protein QGG25_07120 [Phycisphaerae bacterium]|jgi:hypothetical protein|nr:hypothetical protein [Phycisphaerae bacterium]
MSETAQNDTIPRDEVSPLQWCSQNRHFLVVTSVLAVVWLGWAIIMYVMGWVFHKEAVAWPVGVEVHPTEFRMLSMADSFGPGERFKLAGDGELFYPKSGELFRTSGGELLEGSGGVLIYKNRNSRQVFDGGLDKLFRKKKDEPVLDGVPDGENTIIGEVLESLAVGTPLDYETYDDRKSTWYVSRTYIDTNKAKGERYRLWQLDVTYYTGTMDKAPHFPERCLKAAGMILPSDGQGNVQFVADKARNPRWKDPVDYRYVQYRNPRRGVENLHVQYYVYSLNGKPEWSWKAVRLGMSSLFGKYAYFAKIQFHPLNEIHNAEEAKKATQQFVKHMLPEVLKHLPMPEDIKRLESGVQQAKKNSN